MSENETDGAIFCDIVSVDAPCTQENPNAILRPDGEVYVTVRAEGDFDCATVYLTFRYDGKEIPCFLSSSSAIVKTGEDVSFAWLSARQFPDMEINGYLRVQALCGEIRSSQKTFQRLIYINNRGIGRGLNGSTNDELNFRFCGMTREYQRLIQIPREKAVYDKEDGAWYPVQPPVTEETDDKKDEKPFDWATYWIERLGSDYSYHLFQPAETLGEYTHTGDVRRPYYNLYDGYDDVPGRENLSSLRLEYRDEWEAKEKAMPDSDESSASSEESSSATSGFTEYFRETGLGKGVDNVQMFLRPPQYGRGFLIHRPDVVQARNSGLYYDGMELQNDIENIFQGHTDESEEKVVLPPGAEDLKEKPIWKVFYQLDYLHDPNIKESKTIVGLDDGHHYSDGRYWSLFEYALRVSFPIVIEKNVNDRFAFVHNGRLYTGSLLLENEASWKILSEEGLPTLLQILFPPEIFEEHFEYENGIVKIYSLKIDRNRIFQFVPVEHSCYGLFGIDHNTRHSSSVQAKSEEGLVVIEYPSVKSGDSGGEGGESGGDDSGGEGGGKMLFECGCDTGYPVLQEEDSRENSEEPLFTCTPDLVNGYGCHYKYSPERFALYGKIYIRRFSVRAVYSNSSKEPLRRLLDGETSAPSKGYRNFRLEYVGTDENGDRMFRRVYSGIGGMPDVSKEIPVDDDGVDTIDIGWWKVGTDLSDPRKCVSHDYNSEKGRYIRKNPSSFIKKLALRDCWTAEYVPIDVGWVKPWLDEKMQPINCTQPVSHRGEMNHGHVQYLMGAYKRPLSQDETNYSDDFYSGMPNIVPALKERFPSGEAQEGDTKRYDENWGSQKDFELKAGTVVDPMYATAGGDVRTVEKWGYAPTPSLEEYFRIDEDYNGRMLPEAGNTVHGIRRENDISFPQKGRAFLYSRMISDKRKVELLPQDGVKLDLLDFRNTGLLPYQKKNYYSALPMEESEFYQTRPPEIYGEDRPLRISGFIDSMDSLLSWRFLYLQTEWNSYNLIHWEGAQDNSIGARLEVAEVLENGELGRFFPVKTKDSVWVETFSCYIVPYEKLHQSDYIDTMNGTYIVDGREIPFEDGKTYRFRICGQNILTGETNSWRTSSEFTYSRTAYSPPVLLETTYDKWTQTFTISFRFDDVTGRTYDIVNVGFATYEPGEESPPDEAFIWIGTEPVVGELLDLASNREGDNTPRGSLIIHTIEVGKKDLPADLEGKLIRFALDCIPSSERGGMDLPAFKWVMWDNELLRKAERTIRLVLGYKCRWQYVEYTGEDGEEHSGWSYLPAEQAITVPGVIEEQNAIIDGISEKFEQWYLTVGRYDFPGRDARRVFLQSIGEYLRSHISYSGNEPVRTLSIYHRMLQAFINENHSEEYSQFREEYDYLNDDYDEDSPDSSERISRNESALLDLFLEKKGYAEDFEFFLDGRENDFLKVEIQNLMLTEDFDDWMEENRVIPEDELSASYIEDSNLSEDYEKYLEGRADTSEERLEFISQSGHTADFQAYVHSSNLYHDGNYDSRREYVEDNLSSEYEEWKTGREGNEDELLLSFLADDRERWDAYVAVTSNAGKNEAHSAFYSSYDNGITYAQKAQTAMETISSAYRDLSVAYARRNLYETRYRTRLVDSGYFTNGWKNNMPYCTYEDRILTHWEWSEEEERMVKVTEKKRVPILNEVYRMRVEHQSITGKEQSSYESIDYSEGAEEYAPLAGYDLRWNLYFRFQMDFYDSFDSQNGRPLRDVLYQQKRYSQYSEQSGRETELIRIEGAIDADAAGMDVLPGDTYQSDGTGLSPVTDDPYSYQFVGRYSILKSDLPGMRENDTLPDLWDRNTPSITEDDFNHIYFWRVRPYNLVHRPFWEREGAKAVLSKDGDAIDGDFYWRIDGVIHLPPQDRYASSISEIWIAEKRLPSPVWKRDVELATFDRGEPYYCNFFEGTDENRHDIGNPSENLGYDAFRERLDRGEMVYVTDRPQSIDEDGNLSYPVGDVVDQYEATWLPLNSERGNTWVVYDEERGCWYGVSQKSSGTRDGYMEYVLVLSKGMSPQVWGEVCQMFPECSQESLGSVIEDALSFENPCLLRMDGSWRLYFNVLKRDESLFYEAWTATSSDLISWEGFEKIEVDGNPIYPAVYSDGNGYVMYCTMAQSPNRIVRLHSEDGISFGNPENGPVDVYRMTRPSVSGNRLYFGMESEGYGRIASISLADFARGASAPKHVEKGNAFLVNGVPDDSEVVAFGTGDAFFSPYAFTDYDKGHPVTRLCYSCEASSYAFDLRPKGPNGRDNPNYLHCVDTGISGTAWFTEILEEYEWKKMTLRYAGREGAFQGDGTPLAKGQEVPVGGFSIVFKTENEILAAKVPLRAYRSTYYEELEAEGEWIDRMILPETEATLLPEDIPASEEYDESRMTMRNFISEQEMETDYLEWLNASGKTDTEDSQREFLLSSRLYSVYLRWALRGPGIYRHRASVVRKSYFGDGT